MSDLGDLAVFHGLFQLLILFKNSPFFEGRKKTSPCNRVTKKQLKKRKKYLTEKEHPESALQTSAQLVVVVLIQKLS